MAKIDNNIRQHRILANMTQENLATKIGIRRETILHIENKRYTPSLEVALLLAKEFDVPLETLFFFEAEQEEEAAQKSNPRASKSTVF